MKFKLSRNWFRLISVAVGTLVLALSTTMTFAQDAAPEFASLAYVDEVAFRIDFVWVLIAGFLVFFMQAGFAFLEAGSIRQTGVVNSLAENFFDAIITGVVFWAFGYGIAYGTSNGLFGTDTFLFSGMAADGTGLDAPLYLAFFYQFAFAAAAGTIATGAMAERTDFRGKIAYTILIAFFIYPVVVHWIWSSDAWLFAGGFRDFAGSTVVHMTGGIIALIGAIMVGPRVGRVWGSPPPGHNMALAALGTFILWFGWYGFNVGSTLSAQDPGLMGLVTLNTTIAASSASLAAVLFVFLRSGKWNLPAMLNGSLAGLVAITASCAYVSPVSSLIIGLVAGIAVILAMDAVEAAKIDDAVGAFAVHGACGALGTLSIGFFGLDALTGSGSGLLMGGGFSLLVQQLIGVGAVAVYVTITSVIMFGALKALGILRMPAQADAVGIDIYEHGASAWPDVLPLPNEAIAGSDKRASAPAVGD
jgi:Amt family ammonium transporter